MAGADMSDLSFLNKINTTLIFDNEPRNEHIAKRMLTALEKGWRVLVWPDTVPNNKWDRSAPKDINDFILKGLSSDEILKIINKNTYSGQRGRLEVTYWKI